MTTLELAAAVNERGRYRKGDGTAVTAFQINGRTRQYPELFERDGARVRLREPGRPRETTRRFLMYQWNKDQWLGDQAEGREGEPLAHAASNARQFLQLAPGDRLYVVGQWDEKMLLLGRMDVARLMTRPDAEAHFGGPVYEAEHHVIASDCTPERFDRIVPERVARSIASERGARIAFASDSDYRLLSSSLQPRLWLTEKSAEALDQLLDAEATPSNERLDLVADVERRKRGRGRRLNAAQNRAVERRAMVIAQEHYETSGWTAEDVSATSSYDMLCSRSGDELLVEVKGTSGRSLDEVVLTRNEVALARRSVVDLAVVTGIRLAGPPNRPRASGGELTIFEAFTPNDRDLTPLTFAYRLPRRASAS
jgi:hypothetical protein